MWRRFSPGMVPLLAVPLSQRGRGTVLLAKAVGVTARSLDFTITGVPVVVPGA